MKQELNQRSNKLSSKINFAKADNRQVEEVTCWKTNLMIQSQVQRVAQRNQIFHKRTSFEESLLNEHITQMLKVIHTTGLKIFSLKVPQNDKLYIWNIQNKQIEAIRSNQYLTEQQKWQVRQAIFACQQNFSILMRLSSVFQQNKDELLYLLCKILHFCTVDFPIKQKYNSKEQTLLEFMDKSKCKLMDKIVNQGVIKVVNPLFFSNVNQIPLMRIIETWFYHTLCIKQGLYGDKLKLNMKGQETYFQQEDYFEM